MSSTEIAPLTVYQPSELLNIFQSYIASQSVNRAVIGLRGVYLMSDRTYGNVAYDHIRSESSDVQLTVIMPLGLRDKLKTGNLVTVYGTIGRKIKPNNGSIELTLEATRVEKEKDIAISEDEVKRAEFRRIKSQKGFKNVDAILEDKLFTGQRPKVALLYAGTSITDADFNKGLDAAKAAIDFQESRVTFSNAQQLCNALHTIDAQHFDVLAIIRGGGSGIEKLDDIQVVEALANLSTPWIYAIGHEKESLFIRNIADKDIPIPHALGTYFRDTVEAVAQKRNKSRAVLVEEVKKQYEKQIADSNKKNEELNKQLEALQKQHREQSAQSAKQIEALTKAQRDHQTELQKQTAAIKKSNEDALKQAADQIKAAQSQNKQLQEQLQKQTNTLQTLQRQQQDQADQRRTEQRAMRENFDRLLKTSEDQRKQLQSSYDRLASEKASLASQLESARSNSGPSGFLIFALIICIIIIIAMILVR